MIHMNNQMAARANTMSHLKQSTIVNQQTRNFFGRKDKEPEDKQKEESKPAEEEEAKKAADNSEGENKETSKKSDDNDKNTKKENAKGESSSSSSSDEDDLSKEDIAKIKLLFSEQEAEIEELKKKLVKSDKQFKVCRIELTNQVNENKATVARYKKILEDDKQFAITKFAKELLSVRDAIRMALENTNME